MQCILKHCATGNKLITSHLQGPRFNPDLFTCSPCVCMGVIQVFWFPPASLWWIGYFKLPLGMNECVNVCVCACCPALDWCPVHGVFSPHAQCSCHNIHHVSEQEKMVTDMTELFSFMVFKYYLHVYLIWKLCDFFTNGYYFYLFSIYLSINLSKFSFFHFVTDFLLFIHPG